MESKEGLIKMLLSRVLIRNENFCPLDYVCSRKRIIKFNRRSRRSEELSKEKVERMWKELFLLEVLCSFYCKRNELERTWRMWSLTSSLLINSSFRRAKKRIGRKVLNKQGGASNDGSSVTNGTTGGIIFLGC